MTPLLFITYLLALMSCLNAAGQTDTTKPTWRQTEYYIRLDTASTKSYSSISFYNSPGQIQLITETNGVKDTSVYIQGDTMALIKQLLIDYFNHQTKSTQYLAEARAVLGRLNLTYLGNFAFKGDKDYWLKLKRYNKNKNQW